MIDLLIKKVKLGESTIDLAVENGLISEIGQISRRAKKIIDGRGKAILPGFYNLHTHAAMTLLRGYAEDMELADWLTKKIWPAEAKFTADDIYWGTKLAAMEMIKSGTVFFNDMYWHQEAAMQAANEVGVRALIGLTMIDAHPFGQKDQILEAWNRLKDKQTDKVRLALAPHALYTVSEENLRWAASFAKENNLLIHFHLAETQQEVKDCQKKYGLRPVKFLDKIGFLNKSVILAHSIWLTDEDIKIISKRGCSVCYNPASNMKLSSGVMPFSKFKANKINICLGTDSASSNNNLDMVEEMKFGSLLQKLTNGQDIKTKDIFDSATRNGTSYLKLKGGIIKKGQLADFILINTDRLDFLPGFDLLNDLVYSAGSECVDVVVVGGRVVMQDRKIAGEKELINQIRKRYSH